jgi:multiple sugar transport system permease protein
MNGNSHLRTAYLFLAPAMIAIGIFFLLPVVASFVLSFTDFDIYSLSNWKYARLVGFRNYTDLLNDPLFWKSLRNTAYFLFIGGTLSVATSLGTALLLQAKTVRFKGLFRTIYFAPVVTTLVAVAVVWRFVYHPKFGLLNYALSLVGIHPIDWLGDPDWAMPALILMAVWKNFGYNMIIFLAGLQNIPDELYEAASIDGAGKWKQFTAVTLPLLAPTTVFITIITMIGYIQLFAEPYVMTQGGPLNSTLSIVLLMYEQGFRWWNMGYSAAVAFVLFALMVAGSAIQTLVRKKVRPS